MSLEELAFLVLALVAVATALLALFVRELVHTILWIGVFFVDLSAIYFLIDAPFLGVLQLGVYAGAVTILLLFGIMVTRKRIFSREAITGIGALPAALAVATFVFLALVVGEFPGGEQAITSYSVTDLSQALFSQFGVYLLLLGLVMLGALAGAIYLVREGRE
ncbi:MAG: NADH-quinone oxidoreductase subunit J [Candidatus Thermoplasmatota archaeon]|nr:NADH-quinone oxidoreductase subunit J [Candidatus Thermoplasmatota archaeon]